MTVSVEPETIGEAPAERPRPVVDLLFRVLGLVISLVATVVTGVLELFLTPLRIGGVPVGATVLLAGAANAAIAWFAVHTTRRRWAVGPPWALWTVMMIFASGVRTREGDYLVSGNDWIALVMILVGSLAFAIYAYRLILHRTQS
ncbi:hypothetical protein [Jidongwangia harbinensis]|uniref:hypothetical protein n=1 Tax=Jidongwangia harbinensis TaxID=2878561 RepID=UPI001CD9DD41|nr:hypothetical protein [Jidongwangia harbinensis]MCA2214057.1 hypothetical protein [Jidongwangia harbinensis]